MDPPRNRKMSPNSNVEFSSRIERKSCLTKFNEENSRLKTDGALTCGRAKTSVQLKRNGALIHACESLKKDARCKNKKVEICWKKDDPKDKDRSVDVEGQPVFLQKSTNLSGLFVSQFQDVSV